jgi:hypothetical protein
MTKEGLLLDLRAVQIARSLDQIGTALRERGETQESIDADAPHPAGG